MADNEFDIIFRGDIVLGHQLGDVKARLQQLFKIDAERVNALFSGRPVPLKRQLDRATAEKYKQVLEKAGARVELRSSDAAKPAATASAWTLAPVGAPLLRPSEVHVVEPVTVDTSGISLRPAEGDLLDATERSQPVAAPDNIPDPGLSPLGENLLREDELAGLPTLEIDISDWDLAEAGSDLGQIKPDVVPLTPDISYLRLSDQG